MTAASGTLLEARGLSAGHAAPLFPAFDLEVAAGELICLLGRNGAGKTTLLKTLGGILTPLSGTVSLQGRPAASLSGRERALRAALLLTDGALPPFLLGRELVALGRTPHAPWFSGARADDDLAAREAMERLRCAHLAERRLGELSDGERQRLCLARLLAQDAPLLLLDEPLAHMDLPAKAELLALLRDWTRTGRGVLAAVHEVDLALGFADRCLMLIPGEAPFLGSPEQAAGDALHRAFPGWPAFWNPLGLRRRAPG
jgi:iron complex transport system ATP-binding protein